MDSETNEQLQAEVERLRVRVAALEANQKDDYADILHATALTFLKKLTMSDLLDAIVSEAGHLLDTEHGFLYLIEPDADVMRLRSSRGLFKSDVGPVIRPGDAGLISSVWASGQIEIITDYDDWAQRHPDIATGQFKSVVGVPLFGQSRVNGVIALAFKEPAPHLTQKQIVALKGFADLASIALANAYLHERLQESERFIQQVTDTMPILLSIYDIDEQRIIYQNRRVSQVLGHTVEKLADLSTEELTALTHPDDIEKVTSAWSKLATDETGKSSPPVDYRVRHMDGHYHWLRSRFVVFKRHADGSPCQLLNMIEDVTEHYAMEAAHQRSETRFSSIFENAPLGITMTNQDGTIIQTNLRFTEMFGYSTDELLTMTYHDVSVPPYNETEEALIAEVNAGQRDSYQIEKAYRRKDGTIFWGQLTATTMQLDDASIGLGIVEDITEQRAAKEALRRSETRLRVLMENAPVMVFIYKRDSGLVYLNPFILKMGAYEDDDLLGDGFFNILTDDAREDLLNQRDIYETTGALTDRQEICIVTKTGEKRWVDLSLKHIELDDGAAVLGTGLDVTKRKQGEEARIELAVQREQVRFLADFVRDVGHDFRTPLSVITTSLHILERTPDAEARKKRLNNIRNQVFHLERLLDGLMVLVRHDSSVPMTLTQVDINQLIRDTFESMRNTINDAGHTAKLILADPLPPARGSNSELHRAIKNLVENGIRYTPEGGIIEARTSYAEGTITIDIIDNGIGIAAEDLPNIFNRFYRVNEARSSTGLGLGLSIAHKIIERHQGTMTVTSTLDAGSTFTITLPATTHISSASAK